MQEHAVRDATTIETTAAQLPKTWARTLFDSIDAKDATAFVAFLCDDAVFRYGSGAQVQGREAIRMLVDGVFASFRACCHESLQAWSAGERRIFEGFVTYT